MTTRAAALAVVTRDVIGEVANDHGYQCVIEEPFSAIEHLSLKMFLYHGRLVLGSRLFMGC